MHGIFWRRINLHLEAEESTDDQLPLYTPEEQWAKPAKFAVKKKGNKKAKKLCDSLKEAEQLISTLKDAKAYGIEHRPAQRIRCESYCNAKDFCHQYKRENGGNRIPRGVSHCGGKED